MSDLSDKIKEEVRRARRALETLEDDRLDKDKARGALKRLRQHLGAIEQAAGLTGLQLDSFFRRVGEGMLQAQRVLDAESLRYNQELQRHNVPAQPSMFRVPKTSAEFQFTMESSETEGFNIFVAAAEETDRRAVQQKVAFDIVAAPPPPDLLAELETHPPDRLLVWQAEALASIKRRLQQYADGEGEDGISGDKPTPKRKGLAGQMAGRLESLMVLRSNTAFAVFMPFYNEPGNEPAGFHMAVVPYSEAEGVSLAEELRRLSRPPSGKPPYKLRVLGRFFAFAAESPIGWGGAP